MEWAFGVLRWPPDAFWAATPHELMAAIDGYNDAHGAQREEPMNRDELNDLIRLYPDRESARQLKRHTKNVGQKLPGET